MANDDVGHLRFEAARLRAAAARGVWDRPVAACGDWDVQRLVAHVGRVHRWATVAVTTGREPSREALSPPPVDPDELLAWYTEGIGPLVAALEDLEPDAPCWNFTSAAQTGRFWPRRMAHETAIHRWDAERAAGEADPLDPGLAVDTVAEVLDTWAPHRLGTGRVALPGSVHLHCTDAPGEWGFWPDDVGGLRVVDEHVKCDVAVQGSASDLALLLWRRIGPDHEGLRVFGDRAVFDAWLALGVP